MSRVVLVCGDAVGPQMAGPAIRAVELGRVLAARGHEVTVAAVSDTGLEEPSLRVTALDDATVATLAGGADVLIGQGWPLERWPVLREAPAHLVIDLYDPYHLEGLVLDASEPLEARLERHAGRMRVLTHQLEDGDLFLCAGERQRDMWLGALTGAGRVNPRTYARDPSLRSLIDTVPFGLPSSPPPPPRRRAIREAFPVISADDLVLLWGGGLYDWFDPLTLIRAVDLAAQTVPDLRLVLHAAPHPSPTAAPMTMGTRARELSAELGLTGRHVFFNETWVPYAERSDWLSDAAVGVSTHIAHVETEFAFRTRLLDYLWAGLPILCTAGDVLATEVERRGLGITVPPEDVDALAGAIVRLADAGRRQACTDRIADAARELTWESVAGPLVAFCAAPRRAADREGAARGLPAEITPAPSPPAQAAALRRLLRPAVRRVRRRRPPG